MKFKFPQTGDFETLENIEDYIANLNKSLLQITLNERLEVITQLLGCCQNVKRLKYILKKYEKLTITELASESAYQKGKKSQSILESMLASIGSQMSFG